MKHYDRFFELLNRRSTYNEASVAALAEILDPTSLYLRNTAGTLMHLADHPQRVAYRTYSERLYGSI